MSNDFSMDRCLNHDHLVAFLIMEEFYRLDLTEELYWRVDKETGKFRFFVNVNDVFGPASDTEGIVTRADLQRFHDAYEGLMAVNTASTAMELYASVLYVARSRETKPWSAWLHGVRANHPEEAVILEQFFEGMQDKFYKHVDEAD